MKVCRRQGKQKRSLMREAAMQGLLKNVLTEDKCAELSVKQVDALIAELNKETK